jgi:histidinol phosphate phosphatase hisN-like protein
VAHRPEERGEHDPWRPAPYTSRELAAALVAGRVAGPETSHDRANVHRKIRLLVEGDERSQFGIRDLHGSDGPSHHEVLRLMAEAAGSDHDPGLTEGPTAVDPWTVLANCEAAGDRLALAAERGEHVILATGHPAGVILLYVAVGGLLVGGGAKLLRPREAFTWFEGHERRQIRYLHGVAVLTNRANPIHTHASTAMELMLGEATPDLVFADHGFAGAAIQAGIDTISIVDVNDPAPVVAKAQGRTDHVIAMDDNVQPDAYWPCFQAVASRFPDRDLG